MNEIQIFKNGEFGEVRTLVVNNEPMFVGSNVATILGYSNPQKAIRDHVDEDDKLTERIVLSGQNREVIIINESGLYSLILSSKLPSAKKFKHWVTSEVLPAIRKTGGYMVSKQDDTPELIMARALQVAQDTINRHKQQLELANERIALQDTQLKQQAPKVKYVDNVLQSVNTYTTTQMSKELGLREAKQLYNDLKEHGYMFKQSGQWLLTAKYSEKGYTKSRTYQFTRNDGSIGTSSTTVWTEKGRHWLHELQSNNKI